MNEVFLFPFKYFELIKIICLLFAHLRTSFILRCNLTKPKCLLIQKLFFQELPIRNNGTFQFYLILILFVCRMNNSSQIYMNYLFSPQIQLFERPNGQN